MGSAVTAMRDKYERALDKPVTLAVYTVVSTSPLTVYLDNDQTVARPARKLSGQTLSTGDSGMALWISGRTPICLKLDE